MKRLLIIILFLLAGVVVALPGAVGLVAERQHDQIVAQINARSNLLTEDHYERGWYSSSTRYRYRLENEQLGKLAGRITGEPQGTSELLVNSRIYHGPLPVIGGGPGHSVLAWTDMDSTLFLLAPSGAQTPLPGELRSRIEPDGSSRFIYQAKAERRSIRNGLSLSWDDSHVNVLLGRNLETMSATADVGLIELADADTALRFGPTRVTATQQRSRNDLWTGDTLLRIASVSSPGLSAKELMLETRVRESAGQATYAVEIKAENIRGEGFNGDDAYVDLFAQRLDANALGSLLQLINQYSGQPVPIAQRDALLKTLVAAGPEITLRTFRIPMPSADIEGDAYLEVNPGTGITLTEFTRGAKGNATFLVPKDLVQQFSKTTTPEMRGVIELMMRWRVLKPEGNRYRVEAKFAQGLLTINDFPIPIPQL